MKHYAYAGPWRREGRGGSSHIAMRPDFRLGLGDNVFLRNPNGKVSMAGELWSGDSDDDTTDIAEVR